MSDDILSGRDAAALLNCSYSYLYTLMDEGRLHRVKTNSVKKNQPLRFRRDEVKKLLEESTREKDTESSARDVVAA